ncbi:condensation domain-containing protein [Streptomyces cavernicola]|uniref:Condensation domain-containing protein n=1 Tax=Streptomyces cavernicola TaxID=3043613 RepID=A0ABT6SMK9_9ACTN|nr:condensation domain-containing protein [Streptomyces sp. B-S-A6]MDI3409427.1 condensation domain-containing protein [Streptomyces sp. B-S-A6]
MTSTWHGSGSLTAVLALGGAERQATSTLELRGPLDPLLLDAALARVAVDRPELREECPRIVRQGPDRHVLELAAPYPAGVLADLVTAAAGVSGARTAELPEPLALTPLQRELLADPPRHRKQQIGQLLWRWHGRLDTTRFIAAWQSVFDHEAVLRTAFVWDPGPRLALHAGARPDVVRHPHGSLTREALVEEERARGFDLGRPGLLRVALLDGPSPWPDEVASTSYTDVVLTYHQGLLDSWSVGLLTREFYRGYLTEGRPQGRERRPDLRDYRHWLDTQDPSAARDFWTCQGRGPGSGLPRARSGVATGGLGTGRAQLRLTPDEAARLKHWAARWGVTESSVLQAVWAMLLFRADTAARGPAPVRFDVTVSGRGIPMDGIACLPAPVDNPLPMTLRVDPAATVPALLRAARDRALGMAAYEWVSAGQITGWLGDDAGAGFSDTVVSFEHWPSRLEGLETELAAHGLRVADVEPVGGWTGCAMSLVARYDSQGGLVLTAVHDRARLRDDHAAGMLADSARLLRELPCEAGESTPVAQLLAGLTGTDVPRVYDSPVDPEGGSLVQLRGAARPGAGTVCLIAPPGAPGTSHAALARRYRGPEALSVLWADPDRLPESLAALRQLLTVGGPLVLGGFAGAGALACELAGHLAAELGEAPLVVLGAGTNAGDGRMRQLARELGAAARMSRSPRCRTRDSGPDHGRTRRQGAPGSGVPPNAAPHS